NRAGEQILVPNIFATAPPAGEFSVLVRKSTKTVSAVDDKGVVIAQFPASMGSLHDPLPLGKWAIDVIKYNPEFHYNPQLFWDANPNDSIATIAPGPNNPVGLVWMNLSKRHYGIHGTPEPSRIGYSQSHGCIRLTNWDALRVAAMIQPG